MANVYTISIEPVDGPTFKYGFHLGTQERIARFEVEGMFANRQFRRIGANDPVVIKTIALWHGADMVDVFDGRWSSDVQNELFND